MSGDGEIGRACVSRPEKNVPCENFEIVVGMLTCRVSDAGRRALGRWLGN